MNCFPHEEKKSLKTHKGIGIWQESRLNGDHLLLKVQENEDSPCPQVLKADRFFFERAAL